MISHRHLAAWLNDCVPLDTGLDGSARVVGDGLMPLRRARGGVNVVGGTIEIANRNKHIDGAGFKGGEGLDTSLSLFTRHGARQFVCSGYLTVVTDCNLSNYFLFL